MTDINLARDDERDQEPEAPPAGAGVSGYPMNEASGSSPTDAERQAGSTATSTADRVSGYTATEAGEVETSSSEGGTTPASTAPRDADAGGTSSPTGTTETHGHHDHREPFDHHVEGEVKHEDRGSTVEVGRQTRVREGVDVSKEPVEHTEQASGTVHGDEALIEDETTDRHTERMPDSWQNR